MFLQKFSPRRFISIPVLEKVSVTHGQGLGNSSMNSTGSRLALKKVSLVKVALEKYKNKKVAGTGIKTEKDKSIIQD